MLIHFSTEAVLADAETVEIMEHRYLMSEWQRRDVGLVAALSIALPVKPHRNERRDRSSRP